MTKYDLTANLLSTVYRVTEITPDEIRTIENLSKLDGLSALDIAKCIVEGRRIAEQDASLHKTALHLGGTLMRKVKAAAKAATEAAKNA